jgi:hypothetical protein
MTVNETALRRIRAHFGHPSGFWGSAGGGVVASRSSNRRRNVRAISLPHVERHEPVREIGIGPGIAIQAIRRIAVEDDVCGLDHPEQILHRASRRNAALCVPAGSISVRFRRGPARLRRAVSQRSQHQ